MELDSDQQAALTQKYGGDLDQLATVISEVLASVADATSSGIIGEFSAAWFAAAQVVTANGKKAQTALKEVQDLVDKGRVKYVATESNNTRQFLNLP